MIFDATPCTLGEGPLWHPERQELLWFDILGKRLHRVGQHWDFDVYVSAAGWIDHDRLLMASQTALTVFDLTTGTATHVADLETDNPVTRSNDGRADPFGGFWIGTMGINAEPGAGSIYRYYRGEVRRLYSDLTVTNAICFTPDGSAACFTDTESQIIQKVALDDHGWPKGDPAPFIDLTGTDLRPDGAVFDAAGNLWNAQWGAARVAAYDKDGQLMATVPVGGQQSSCPAFGGPDLTTLYCTTAAVGLTGPDEGKTFVAQTQTKGQAEHCVIL